MRFSAAPGLPAPALTTTVSPLGTSFTTPRIHPVAMIGSLMCYAAAGASGKAWSRRDLRRAQGQPIG